MPRTHIPGLDPPDSPKDGMDVRVKFLITRLITKRVWVLLSDTSLSLRLKSKKRSGGFFWRRGNASKWLFVKMGMLSSSGKINNFLWFIINTEEEQDVGCCAKLRTSLHFLSIVLLTKFTNFQNKTYIKSSLIYKKKINFRGQGMIAKNAPERYNEYAMKCYNTQI